MYANESLHALSAQYSLFERCLRRLQQSNAGISGSFFTHEDGLSLATALTYETQEGVSAAMLASAFDGVCSKLTSHLGLQSLQSVTLDCGNALLNGRIIKLDADTQVTLWLIYEHHVEALQLHHEIDCAIADLIAEYNLLPSAA